MTEDPRSVVKHCPGCGGAEFVWMVPRRDDKERQVCSGCGYIHYAGPALAAGLILLDGDRICLVKRAHEPGTGKWTFPGGFVDLEEDPAAAALRETMEETGYHAGIDRLVGAYRSEGPRGRRVVILAYAGRVAEGTDRTSDEVALSFSLVAERVDLDSFADADLGTVGHHPKSGELIRPEFTLIEDAPIGRRDQQCGTHEGLRPGPIGHSGKAQQ